MPLKHYQNNYTVLPLTFNVDINVALLFNVAKPLTFKDDIHVVLFNVEYPDTFKDDINIVLFNVEYPYTFNDDINVVLLYNVVKPLTFNMFDVIESPLIFQ